MEIQIVYLFMLYSVFFLLIGWILGFMTGTRKILIDIQKQMLIKKVGKVKRR